MTIDYRIKIAVDHFNIQRPEDWCEIRPEWVRTLHGIGDRTLDMIRLYLAARGLTLRDDATADFWNRNLQSATIGGQLAITDQAITETFTILIDSQEKKPWTFQGFRQDGKPLVVPIKFQTLGPTHGDYSVAGCQELISIERKSIQDALGTFLSHGDRRDRWLATLNYLASIPHGHVVIEGTIFQCVSSIEPRGTRSKKALAAEFIGSVQSWSDLRIPFWFLDSPRLAEDWARKLLKRSWLYASGQRTRERRDENSIDAVIDLL